MELPDAIRHATLFPESDLPAFPTDHETRRVEVAGVLVILPGGLPRGLVLPERVEGSVEHVVGAVRQLLRAEEREQGIWMVPEASSPDGLAQSLLALGMKPKDEVPGGDARVALMAGREEPPPGPADLVARPAATFEEFSAALMVVPEALEMDEKMRKAFEQRAEQLWPFQFEPGGLQTFVALLDDEVIAFGAARFGGRTVYLSGGGTRPDYRGRGAYRALVRARWDAAVERGTPILTVGAGAMSRPILERLGFSIVGWADRLLDELG
jgi:GNAT superfamily N-acetyltransferase